MGKPSLFADDLWFAECPRWHEGALFMSDMWDHTVYRFDPDGSRSVVVRFSDEEEPGGLGFLPDGRMLVVGMLGRCVYVLEGNRPVVYADLKNLAPFKCNDMIVLPNGRAFISQLGFESGNLAAFKPTQLLCVEPDGEARVAADDLYIPNGVALNGDGSLLAVAESHASRIAFFDIGTDGDLSNRRNVEVPAAPGSTRAVPDGICFDRSDGLWVGEVEGKQLLRLDIDGHITEQIGYDAYPLAVVLGGPDRRTLFVCVSAQMMDGRSRQHLARIDCLTVDVPGAGEP